MKISLAKTLAEAAGENVVRARTASELDDCIGRLSGR
jgi:hypothetical protein